MPKIPGTNIYLGPVLYVGQVGSQGRARRHHSN